MATSVRLEKKVTSHHFSCEKILAIAPMMDWTDRHCRYLHRLLSPHARLYTEMVHAQAVLHGDLERLLGFDASEHPLALQLGGSEPEDLAHAAGIGADRGYDEINLNCGCPSERVQRGSFGACLMGEPERVAACVAAMRARVGVPVTVKCRIGIDDSEELAFLVRFVETVAAAGCGTFIVHARKAWLKGLSPRENREIPPLRYGVVRELKAMFPQFRIVLNGGLRSPEVALAEAEGLDGVMIGREAYENPYALTAFEAALFPGAVTPSRAAVIEAMRTYAEARMATGTPLRTVVRPLLGLCNGLAGARAFRRRLSTLGPSDGPEVLAEAFALTQPELARAA